MRVYFLLMSVLCLASCAIVGLDEQEDGSIVCLEERYSITVEVDLPQSAADLKSSFTDDALNRIYDLNIFIYHEGELLKEHSGYFTDMSSLMLSFPSDKNGFDIYMFGNVGEVEAPDDEGDIIRMPWVIESYEDIMHRGVPVANVFPDHIKGTLAVFGLKRLVGQYNISLQPSAQSADYVVKDVRLHNCALDVYPFASDMKATRFTASGVYGESASADVLTADDVDRLNSGESVSLYFLENLQGELLPGNSDSRKKIPSSLDSIEKGLQDRCTYIEITADITTPAARYTDARYRFYLGRNQTTDFSVRRNTLYDVTLDFTQNMVCEQEWRIEVGEPLVDSLVISKDEVHVVKGVSDYVLIDGPEVRINLDESDSDAEFDCILSDVMIDGRKYQRLMFSTSADIVGLYEWKKDYRGLAREYDVVVESVETYNGRPLLKRRVKAYVYDRVFPLFIRMTDAGTSAPYMVEVLTNAPVSCKLQVAAEVTADVCVSDVTNVYSYRTSASSMGTSSEGYSSCQALFSGLYDTPGSGDNKTVIFREMDVELSGIPDECCSAGELYVGSGGKVYWGPGQNRYPQRYSDLSSGSDFDMYHMHSCSLSGCIKYEIVSGSSVLFRMAPESKTCSSVRTTGTSNSLVWNVDDYNSCRYIPFYVANGDLNYAYPVVLQNDSPKYLDDSARRSIIYEVYGPGRDIFYPNGVSWGEYSGGSPSVKHRFGYTAGMVKQFLGNVHTWQIYQDYECDFYMTVNGCTAWPGASRLSTGFRLSYDL